MSAEPPNFAWYVFNVIDVSQGSDPLGFLISLNTPGQKIIHKILALLDSSVYLCKARETKSLITKQFSYEHF